MAENPKTKTDGRSRSLSALLLLCFFLAIGAMRADLFPAPSAKSAPQIEREALPLALLAVVAASFAAARRATWPRGKQLFPPILMGLALFVAPSVLVHFALGWVSAFTRVVLFSLTPVFAVVFEPHQGRSAASQSRSGLLAALVSLIGMLCVFPVDTPATIQAGCAFAVVIAAAACVATANCYAVRLASELQQGTISPAVAIACAAAALGLVVAGIATEGLPAHLSMAGQDLAWSLIVALPGLLLLFWLMPRMTAVRMTTRFVLAPLMAILIGMAIDRPALGPRIWMGLLLVAGGAAWLLLAPDDQPTANSSTFNLNRD
jgi:drug/metabolite transporter (DMT)-like permease